MAILPLSVMFFMVLQGYVYTITMYFYAFRFAFSSILHGIQQHFTLRLAAFYLAFSTKTHCIQRHIAPRLAPKCTAFSCKQPQIWCKRPFYLIKIHFGSIHNNALLAPKQTLARIENLRSGSRLVEKKGTHNVKNRAENFTHGKI